MSRHGLGLSSEVFWSLRASEFLALKTLWAAEEAKYYNAHFVHGGAAWIADDFLYKGNRERRIEQAKRDKSEEDMLNFKLARIQQTKEAKGVPFWALQDWDGTVPEGVKPYAR